MVTLAELANLVDGHIVGNPDRQIEGLGSLASATAQQISHLSNPAYKKQLAATSAGAVLLKEEDLDDCPCDAVVVANPYLAFARVSQRFVRRPQRYPGVHPSAVIAATSQIHDSASIGPNVVIGEETVVGAECIVGANTVIGERCVLGQRVELKPNVTLYDDVHMGDACTIHSGAVLGADGFGFTPNEKGHWEAIAQLGGVRIGDNVSIGAGSAVDRGAIEDTIIEDGVQIDNHVQIGHNCIVGAHSLLCGMVGFAGSTTIGKHCVFGGRSGAGGDHPIDVCDNVMVTSCTVLSQSVKKPGVYSGSMLFHEHTTWRRNALRFASLDDLFKRVRRIEKRQAE